MYGDFTKASVCRILRRQEDGEGEVLGTGCLFSGSAVQGISLKIATSKRIFQNPKDSKFFAIFTDLSGKRHELELGRGLPDKEHRNSEIAYFSVDKSLLAGSKATACFEGIQVSSQSQENLDAVRYRVLIRTVQSYDKDEVVARRVVFFKDQSCCSLHTENPEQGNDGFDGLAVQGSPILVLYNCVVEFWGIVDFSEAGKNIFQFFRHVFDKDGVYAQETQSAPQVVDSKLLSPDDQLEKLWENQYFKDDLSKPLDFEHLPGSNIKNWRHFAQELEVPKEECDQIAFSKFSPTSPTENLFEYLRSQNPVFLVKDLCKIFETAKVHHVSRAVNKSIRGGKLKCKDRVSELRDKDPELMKTITIKLDSAERWKRVATALGIPEQKCAFFTRDPNFNPTRLFFEILRTQSPELRISKLKNYLAKLEQKEMLEQMKSISENTRLKDLPSEAALMCDAIEPKFNATKNQLLYKLAELFQRDGYLRDVDIHDFSACEIQGSPTCEVMDYVLACQPIEYKIKDLVECLVKIDRIDVCEDAVKKYLKKPERVDQMVQVFKQLKLESTKRSMPAPPLARETSYYSVDDEKA